MLIAGYNPNSYVDFPKNIAAVIFTCGCNLDCSYCHNRWLIDFKQSVDSGVIIEKIEKRKAFLDGVVITGGEPTLQDEKELTALITAVKNMGLKVKLDTNGTNPEVLERLLDKIDYIAMDVKAPLDKYSLITEISDKDIENIKKSIEIVKKSGGEFRTTVASCLTLDDVAEIAKTVSGGNAVYYIQRMNPLKDGEKTHTKEFLEEAARVAGKYVKTQTRNI